MYITLRDPVCFCIHVCMKSYMYLSLTCITWKTKENLWNENCANQEVIIDENVESVYDLIYLIMFILINTEAFKVKETML